MQFEAVQLQVERVVDKWTEFLRCVLACIEPDKLHFGARGGNCWHELVAIRAGRGHRVNGDERC